MSQNDLQQIVDMLWDRMASSTHMCFHAEDWGRVKTALENNEKQNKSLYELLTDMDCKFDSLREEMTKLKTERNVFVWLAGGLSGLIASLVIKMIK